MKPNKNIEGTEILNHVKSLFVKSNKFESKFYGKCVFDEKSGWILLNDLAIEGFVHARSFYAKKNLTHLVREPISVPKLQSMVKVLKEKDGKETWAFER